MENQNIKAEKKVGESGYINKNCWLARNLNYLPPKRCQYCELRFTKCLFERYLVISLILVFLLLLISYAIEKNISNSLVVSIFVLVIVYGYFFNKSTESIIEANFSEKKSKEAFKELSETLQQKVDEQTKRIKQAYEVEKQAHEELKKVDNTKTQFMLATQHHLRTPLSTNMGFLDLLLNNDFGKVPPKIKKVILRLQNSTLKEIQVVNDLLNVSQFQLGREVMQLEPGVNVESLLKEVSKDLVIEAKKKGIYLRIKKQKAGNVPTIAADKIKLKLALINIVDNAVKYTKEGGVEVEVRVPNPKQILIEIKDTGIGLSQESISNLFKQTFHRGKEAQKMFAVGKGVGLFLSAKIIEGHKGRVWAESGGEGRGSTFYIELPVG